MSIPEPKVEHPTKLVQISAPYLLITSIPSYVDDDGNIWLDGLWHRDLQEHLNYLRNFTLLSPIQKLENADSDLMILSPPPETAFRYAPIDSPGTFFRALIGLPKLFNTLWAEISHAEVVHSGVIGWPIPIGWIANPIALLKDRHLVLVVESAPWRLVENGKHSVKARIRAFATEYLARYFMRRADLAISTQPGYLRTLRGSGSQGLELINPASWIDKSNVISVGLAEKAWVRRREESSAARLLFVGRMTREKGVQVLLDSLSILESKGCRLRCDFIGSGALKNQVELLAQSCSSVQISVFEPVTYDSRFFEFLRLYDAIVLPSLSDEQPRILFDAFSQGLAVIGSDTEGIKFLVTDRLNGWVTPVGDATALSNTIESVSRDIHEIKQCGLNAIQIAREMTHEEMHIKRSVKIANMLERVR